MNKLMEKAIEALTRLPEDRQEELAEYILSVSEEPAVLTDDEKAAIDEGMADLKAGRFASDVEVEATFKRLRST